MEILFIPKVTTEQINAALVAPVVIAPPPGEGKQWLLLSEKPLVDFILGDGFAVMSMKAE